MIGWLNVPYLVPGYKVSSKQAHYPMIVCASLLLDQVGMIVIVQWGAYAGTTPGPSQGASSALGESSRPEHRLTNRLYFVSNQTMANDSPSPKF